MRIDEKRYKRETRCRNALLKEGNEDTHFYIRSFMEVAVVHRSLPMKNFNIFLLKLYYIIIISYSYIAFCHYYYHLIIIIICDIY